MTGDDRSDDDDVPIRVDFRDPATARTWIEDTRIRRPYRPRFFAAFCAALAARPKPLRILELGSGPGQLARENLVHCDVRTYVALDFSPAMHAIAAEHLGELASRVTFATRDFREAAWPEDLGQFDAVVTLQAAHETRHKRHLVPLLERARTRVAAGGVVLYADHYLTPETKLPALAPARADQPLALERAGFVDVRLCYEEGNMALWCGTNPVEIVIALRVPPEDVRHLYHTWLLGLWAGELQRKEPALPARHTDQDVIRRVTPVQLAQLLAALPSKQSAGISIARMVGEFVIPEETSANVSSSIATSGSWAASTRRVRSRSQTSLRA